jgi:hypothetical protein
MATYGPRDTSLLALPDGWDGATLEKYRLEDGTTFATVAAMLNSAVQAKASGLVSDPLWSSLVSYTDMPQVEVVAHADGPSAACRVSDAVFAATAAAVWRLQGCPPVWPTGTLLPASPAAAG